MTKKHLILLAALLLAVSIAWLASPLPVPASPGRGSVLAALPDTVMPTATATSTATVTLTPTATPTPKTASAPRAAALPSVDGNTGEWDGLVPQVLDKDHASHIEGWDPAPAPSDISAVLWSAWTPNTLYFAANIADDVLMGNNSPLQWDDDVIEISVTTDRTHQFSICVDGRLTDGGSPVIAPLTVVTRTVPAGWQLEVAIPAAALGLSSLSADVKYPFTFGMWDDDLGNPGGFGQTHIFWQGTSTNDYQPTWGFLHLLPTTYNFPSLTATPTPTATATPTRTATPTVTHTPTPTPTATLGSGSLVGTVWHDLDGDALKEPGEPGLVGIQVSLLRAGILFSTATTGSDGTYGFPGLTPGAYTVRETHPLWLHFSSTLDEVPAAVTTGGVSVVNFGDWAGIPEWLPAILHE